MAFDDYEDPAEARRYRDPLLAQLNGPSQSTASTNNAPYSLDGQGGQPPRIVSPDEEQRMRDQYGIPSGPPQDARAVASTGQGGSSREAALRRVQQAYQQYLPHQMGEVDSATDDMLRRATGYSGYTEDRAFADLVEQLQRRAGNAPGGGGASAYTGGGTQAGAGDAALSQFMQYLQSQQARQDQERAQMREILMQQLGQASQPISPDSPGIREILAGQRIGLDRGVERGRRDAAEQRAYEGYGVNSDVLRTDVERLNQNRGETEARLTGEAMNRELGQRREHLQRLLQMAVASGDAEAARSIQAQLATIQTQLNQSNFLDQMGFNYAQMNSGMNLNALLALLNAA